MRNISRKKAVRSQDVVFLEDNTIEDSEQRKSESTTQSTPTIVDLRPSEPTQSAVRRQLVGRAESESFDSKKPSNANELESADLLKSVEEYELESANPEQPIDMYEPDMGEELAETFELEPTTSGGRYPLREEHRLHMLVNPSS